MKTILPLEERRARWAAITEMTDEQLREWLFRGQRKPALFLVPKPAPEPEQLSLDFDSEVEKVIADVLERKQPRPKVG